MTPGSRLNSKEAGSKVAAQIRVGFAVVAFLAFASAALGAIQISRTIKSPFLPKNKVAKSEIPSEEERKQELKNLDTDKDSLSDYDELNIYHTSPFIEDSDSDGDLDNNEVASGEDPNCPKGKNCFSSVFATTTPGADEQANSLFTNNLLGGNTAGILGNAFDIRKELGNLGVPSQLFQNISDDELLKLYTETLQEVLVSSTSKDNQNGNQ